jgi:protocatechuate 3,4-dioxygenase beta subunit
LWTRCLKPDPDAKQTIIITQMNTIVRAGIFVTHFSLLISCGGQSKTNRHEPAWPAQPTVGGGCEGCELMYVEMPQRVTPEHTSIGWAKGSQKLVVTGTALQPDGKTPAPNVIIYYWHTDDNGLYAPDSQTPEKARAHGNLRGWVKTDENGFYKINTSRPAAYPGQDIPQHIHLSIKEPDIGNEYFADLYFADDPLYLNHQKKYGKADRAGNELLTVVDDGRVQVARHNIMLGLNIPNYPAKRR